MYKNTVGGQLFPESCNYEVEFFLCSCKKAASEKGLDGNFCRGDAFYGSLVGESVMVSRATEPDRPAFQASSGWW